MEALALWRFGSLGHCRIEALGSETVTPNGAFTAASAGIFAGVSARAVGSGPLRTVSCSSAVSDPVSGMSGQIALEPFDSGIHEPGLTVKAASPHAAALPIADVDLLPVDRGGATPPTPSTSNCAASTLLKRPHDEDGNHCSLAPLADLDANLDLAGDGESMDPSEAKRQKRMRRNRESAAMSRERKKAYIEQLESKLSELSALASQLRSENDALRNGRAPLEGSAPVPVGLSSALVSRPTKPEDSLLLMPCLQTSDNDSESNDGTDPTPEVYSSLEVFSQEPPSSLTLPAEPAALFVSAIDSFDS